MFCISYVSHLSEQWKEADQDIQVNH